MFEPLCPSNTLRLKSIEEINKSGIPTCITLTPLLPVENADDFAKSLLDTGVKKFVIQPFHSKKGGFVGSTREDAARLINEMEWTKDKYNQVCAVLRKYIPDLEEGKDGFKPI